jgi:hypothetical protein
MGLILEEVSTNLLAGGAAGRQSGGRYTANVWPDAIEGYDRKN